MLSQFHREDEPPNGRRKENDMADITYEIVEHIGALSENAKGWTKELNKISWNTAPGTIKVPRYKVLIWAVGNDIPLSIMAKRSGFLEVHQER